MPYDTLFIAAAAMRVVYWTVTKDADGNIVGDAPEKVVDFVHDYPNAIRF